jgi:putative CocE/NonD family hydrolase
MSSSKDTFPSNYSADFFEGKFSDLDLDWPGDMTKSIYQNGADYTTALLSGDTQITGNPLAHLWVSSTMTDGDFFLFLEDIDPDDVSHYVSHGVIRASRRAPFTPEWDNQGLPYHRDFRQDRKALIPDQPAQLDFALGPTSYVFAAGHRIRITITTSAGKAFQSLAFFPAPEISIYHDSKYASYVTLPLMPAAP